jgi:dolichol-phosphate mannosyltransferase
VKALVTGAGGFVGANLVSHLLELGHDVVAIERPNGTDWRLERVGADADVVELDLLDGDGVKRVVHRVRPEWIFHLAAYGAYSWQRDSERIMQTNLVSTVRLLAACEAEGFGAFIHAGSSSEYGFKDHAPLETERVDPNSDYAVMKSAATTHGRFVAQRDDFHIVTLRLYSVFGPWEEPGRLMPTLCARGLEGRLPPLVAPDTPRDFITIADTNRAFIAAAERTDVPRGSVYNIGSGRETKLREVVAIALEEFGIDAEPEWGTEPQRDWDAKVWVGDPSLAAAELDWRARDDVATGFRAIADWLRQQHDLWPRYGVERPTLR